MKRIISIMLVIIAAVGISYAFETTDAYNQTLRHCRYQASYALTIAPTSNSFILVASGNNQVPLTLTATIIGTPAFGSWTINRYKGPIKWTNGAVYTNTAFAPDYHATIFEKVSGVYDLQDLNYFGAPYPQPIACWEYTHNGATWTWFTNAWGGNGISNRGTLTTTWTYNVPSGGNLTQVNPPIVIGANTHEFLIISNTGATGSNLSLRLAVEAYIGR